MGQKERVNERLPIALDPEFLRQKDTQIDREREREREEE